MVNFESELKQCNTMKEVLIIVNKYYILDRPLGIGTKIMVLSGLKKILTLIKAEPK